MTTRKTHPSTNHNVETCKVKKDRGTHYIIVVEDIV
jgi:hypothetical protein